MAKSRRQIYDEIVAFMDKQNRAYSDWYCGIASDPRDRLFREHNVPEENGWIYRQCNNNADARAVEDDLLKLGCDGGVGGGDETTIYVYAYIKKAGTNP